MNKSGSSRRSWIAVVAGIVLTAAIIFWRRPDSEPSPVPPAAEVGKQAALRPLPELPTLVRAKSRHLNTGSDARFVGNVVCRSCHSEQYASYQLTGHSRALSRVDLAEEPPDTEYFHSPSGRWYKVYRQEGELRHRESVRAESGKELVLNDYAVQWAIGSGRFSKSYLIEQDGFLIESPITWYAANEHWGMSPGYDRPLHQGFERLADQGCLVCHAGRVTAQEGNAFRPEVHHMTIGCESCHGPGSMHVAAREQAAPADGEEDLTIVNPAHLSRELSESVCASCHLRGQATVFRRGLGFDDLRPGLPLTDVRMDYGLVDPSGEMEVVGHVEQMRLSRCYTESQTMTCITCHDPHHQPTEAERVRLYRQACLECHGEDACGKPVLERLQVDKQDNCTTCHMPTTDTDIPHFAFTHHRIAVPSETASPTTTSNPAGELSLKPMADLLHLSLAERNRALGLAYIEFAEKQPGQYEMLLRRAQGLLEQGEQDGESAAALARIYWELGDDRAVAQAERALSAAELSSQSRTNALVVRGSARLEAGRPAAAAADFQTLTQLRRHPGYWQVLGEARHAENDLPRAVAALEKAIQIAPQRADLRARLGDHYTRLGRRADAAQQRNAIELLRGSTAGR